LLVGRLLLGGGLLVGGLLLAVPADRIGRGGCRAGDHCGAGDRAEQSGTASSTKHGIPLQW
jgi:hypothetical protein